MDKRIVTVLITQYAVRVHVTTNQLTEKDRKMTTKYPNVTVEMDIDGPDGNAFAIMGRVQAALKKAGATKEELDQYSNESMSGDYENLLATADKWVNFLV